MKTFLINQSIMRDQNYPNRNLRCEQKVWDMHNNIRKELGVTWNVYLKKLYDLAKDNKDKLK